jgi:predicted MFS family arabinose efflux permease
VAGFFQKALRARLRPHSFPASRYHFILASAEERTNACRCDSPRSRKFTNEIDFAEQPGLRNFVIAMITKAVGAYRNAYADLSRNTWLLSLVMLINRSGTMVVPFMSLYLISLGYSIGAAGFVYGVFGAGAFTGAWLGGRLTDRIGFYPVQLITLSAGGLLFMLLGQMKTYPSICIVAFILSFINEAFRPANSTAIAFYSKEENRTRSYSLNRLAINMGWAIGSAIGGVLARIDYGWLFWVDGITNIGAAGLLLAFVKPVHQPSVPDKKPESVIRQSALRDTTYMWFIVLAAFFAACFFQLFTNLSVYYKLELGFTEPFIGLLMAVNGVIIVLIEMVVVHRLEGRRRNTVYIITGTLLMGLAYAMLNCFHMNHGLAFVMVLVITFAEIMAMPFMNSYWISRSKSYNRGQYAALYTMAWSVAQTFGPLAGAQVAEHIGFSVLWWGVMILSVLTAAGFLRLHRYVGRQEITERFNKPLNKSIEHMASEEPQL